jgi:hypothetical protein
LIVPTAFTGDTIEPEIDKPSSPAKEKSPSWTAGGGEKVKAGDPSHETLTSVSSRIVNRMSFSYSAPACATHYPLKSKDSGGANV